MTKQEFKSVYDLNVKIIRNYLYYRSGDTVIADDITQETFIKLWEKEFNYEPDKTKNLLYKIANDLFLDYIRKQKLETEYVGEIKFNIKKTIEEDKEKSEIKEKCEKALAGLSEKERVVFLMNKKDGLNYSTIAEALMISVKAVEKRMSNALKKLIIK